MGAVSAGTLDMEFLEEIWVGQKNHGWGFLCVKDGAFWRDIAMRVERTGEIEFPELDQFEGMDVYFTPNLFGSPVRRKEHMLASCWLYADLDRVDPYGIDRSYRPTIAWRSSTRRYQAMWELPYALDMEPHGVLNKKLTYYLEADRSGWDATQVLRVPGTLNYKYDPPEKVKLLWDDAPLVRSWKKVKHVETVAKPRLSVVHVKKGKLPPSVRAKLGAKVATGDRSKVLWRLEKQLLELGYSEAEVFSLLKPTVWNKFDTDDRLFAEIQRAAA